MCILYLINAYDIKSQKEKFNQELFFFLLNTALDNLFQSCNPLLLHLIASQSFVTIVPSISNISVAAIPSIIVSVVLIYPPSLRSCYLNQLS
jgi:ABC-type proline/glycine betaine transport system permease subunit